MSLELIGEFSASRREGLTQFHAALQQRGFLNDTDVRLVAARPGFFGLVNRIIPALRQWMQTDAFREWQAQQAGRPVQTAGKTFVAHDGVVTAVVSSFPNDGMFLGIAAHELVECALLSERDEAEGPQLTGADLLDQIHGSVLQNEYSAERLRFQIQSELGWAENAFDAHPGLYEQTDDLQAVMGGMEWSEDPPDEFWLHWVNIARMWVMVQGRAAAGSASALAELARWSEHPLIAFGWRGIAENMERLDAQSEAVSPPPGTGPTLLVWKPIEELGRAVWSAR